MEIQELVAGVFGTGSCAVCRESTPRANMAYCFALFITRQQYSIVLERFCGERVRGTVKSDGKEESKPAPSKTARDAAPKFVMALQGCATRLDWREQGNWKIEKWGSGREGWAGILEQG
jgi:hypothetical protein